jgi:trigger factor
MQIKVENLSTVKKKINFEIPAERVGDEIDKVYEQIRKKASIKGFRKGKVPFALIEKHYSPQMEADVIRNLVNDTYFKALMDAKIYPVSHPTIESDELKKGAPFTYSATVEVFPEVKVKDFDGLEVKRERYEFTDEVIDARLQEMQESVAQMKPVEGRPAAMGDFVTLDFVGSFDGVPFENGSAEDFVLELGSGRFIPGFEEQVVGLEIGTEKEVAVTFPQDYSHAEFAGKEAIFALTIKGIKCKELPPLDDEFVKEFGEFETLADLRGKLQEFHEKREQDRIEGELRERLVKALIDRNNLEVPETLVERQLESMLESTKRRLSQQRLSLEMMGLDEEQYRIKFRDVAEGQVKGSLLLEGLAKQEGMDVTDEDLDARFAQIAEQSGQNPDGVKKYYLQNEHARENITAQIREDKAIDFLLKRATITEVSREEL